MQRVADVARLRFTTGTIEALKWLALACMVVDHVNLVLFDRELGAWADVLGRIAFPIFALVFGYNLARPGANPLRLAKRLAMFGALVTPLYLLTIDTFPLNVFFTFAVAAVLVQAFESDSLGTVVVALLVALLVDYGPTGVALVAGGYVIARHGLTRFTGLALVVTLYALSWSNGNAWALLALPLVAIATRLDVAVPRLRWAFYAAYPAHLVAIALLAGV